MPVAIKSRVLLPPESRAVGHVAGGVEPGRKANKPHGQYQHAKVAVLAVKVHVGVVAGVLEEALRPARALAY
jgi:hypothetical protein